MQNHAKHLSRFLCVFSIASVSGVVALSSKSAHAFPEKLNVYNEPYTVVTAGTDQIIVDVTLYHYPSDSITNTYGLTDETGLQDYSGQLDHTTATYTLTQNQTHQDPVRISAGAPLPVYFYSQAQALNGGDSESGNTEEITGFTCDAVQVIGSGTQQHSGPFTFGTPARTDWYTVQVGVATAKQQDHLQLDYSASAGIVPDPKQDTLALGANTSVVRSVLIPVGKVNQPLLFKLQDHAGTVALQYQLGLNPVSKTVGPLTLSAGPLFSAVAWKVPIDPHLNLPAKIAAAKHSHMKVFLSAKDGRHNDLEATVSGQTTNLTYTPGANGAAGTWDGPKSVSLNATGVQGPVTLSAILVMFDNGGGKPTYIHHSTITFGP